MKKSYKAQTFFGGLKFSFAQSISQSKGKIIMSFVMILIAICTGIFVAIKSNNNFSLGCLQEIDIGDFYSGFVASTSAFFSRTLSLVVNILILTVVSFSKYLFPLAQVLFAYRGYLFGLNFALMFVFYGFGGIFTAIIIILPCQLATICILVIFYIILSKLNADCHKFGCCECNRLLFVVVFILLALFLNLIETLLLLVLNGRVILVI